MLKKYFFSFIITTISTSYIIAAEDNFERALPKCDDNQKILELINKTNNENRVMCVQPEHELYKYAKEHQGHELHIRVNEK